MWDEAGRENMKNWWILLLDPNRRIYRAKGGKEKEKTLTFMRFLLETE